jgi:hypothetical protein
MTNLKQLTLSSMYLFWGHMGPLKDLDHLMELQIFDMALIRDCDFIDIAQNCPKLLKFIFDSTGTWCPPPRCPYPLQITLDGIKKFVQECTSKNSISHVEIYQNYHKNIDKQDWDSLVQLVNESLQKIVIFKINHQTV